MKKILSIVVILIQAALAFGQSGTISGVITDDSGQPVIGAAIFYDGLNSVNTTSNFKGEFSIKSMPGKTLVVSCIGMKDAKVLISKQSKLDIKMEADDLFLNDAIVIGYGVQNKGDLTGSIASVKSDEIRQSAKLDVLGSLQGKVAGLAISSHSGEPGAGYNIQVRGNNSINAATTPLIVIDGMQMDISESEVATSSLSTSGSDPLAFLNPVDIQSVEVLKDASATAIYGSRGANGVILITTKSGSADAGKTSVTFDASFNITSPASEIEMLDGQEWINFRFERKNNEWWYFGKDTDGDGVLDSPKTLEDYGRNAVNWRDEMLRNAFSQQYNLSVRSNFGKGAQVLASIGWLDQQGMIVNNGYNKFTAKVKVDHEINKKVKYGVNVNYARTKAYGAATSTGGSFTSHGLIQMMYLEKPIEKFVDPADPSSYYTSTTSIYDCVSSETSREGIADRLMGNAYFQWHIIPDLTFRAYASGSLIDSSNDEFYSVNTRWGHSNNGVASCATTNSTSISANATLTYKHSWKKRHNFDAMAGMEINDYHYKSYYQEAVDFEDASLREKVLAKGTLKNPVQNENSNGRMSAFGRINYNYDWRYYATINFRADGSSKFSAGSRVGYFPSFSAAWKISNEPWMKTAKKKWMDNLKIRASAGASGNDRISNYANLSTLNQVYYSSGTGTQILGMAEYTSGNKNLKWETTYQYDLGLDINLFKNRVDFVFDAYYKDTRDMLFLATLPYQSGFTSQWQNIGRVENKGLEFTLNTVNIKRGDFTWSSNLTISTNANKVLDLGEGVSVVANNVAKGAFTEEPTQLMVGQPIGIIWGYVWDGNYQLSDFDIYYRSTKIPVDSKFVTSENYNDFDYVLKEGVTKINGVEPKPGDRKLKDLDGDGIVKSTDDKTVIGNCYPRLTYGFGNTFSWRGLSLYIFFNGVQGKDVLNEFKYSSTSGEINDYTNITKDNYVNAWRPENGSNKHARLNNQINCQKPLSSYFVEDASFLKLKTLSLSYSLPSKALRAIRFDGLKFTFTVDNVYTWTKYEGLDPDFSSSNTTFPGLDRLSYPAGRTFSLGIIANF